MKQTYFIITLMITLTIGILSINSVELLTLGQEENDTSSEIENSPLITTPELEESITTNNKSSYLDNNNTSMIEEILP
jgi:hypothetical protein